MAFHSRIVLIVGNTGEVRAELEVVLRADGYRVLCSEDGEAALEYLRLGLSPCLVIVHLIGPRMTSDEFIAEAKRLPGSGSVPLIVLRSLLLQVLANPRPRPEPIPIDELLQVLEQRIEA
jgi:CheY-like chemotaxis protein